jgi:hypothetical protein
MEEIQGKSRGHKKLDYPVWDTEVSDFSRTYRIRLGFEI